MPFRSKGLVDRYKKCKKARCSIFIDDTRYLAIKVILIMSYDTRFALFTRQNLRFGLVGQFRVLKFHVLFIAVLSGILVRFGKNDVADTN